MSEPNIIDLRKQDEDEEDPSRNPENEMDTESEGDVHENAGDYPDDVEDNTESGDPDENRKDPSGQEREEYSDYTEEELEEGTDVEPTEKGDEKAFSIRDYNITNKFDGEKGFADLKEGSLCLIDTPLDGAKVGEVVGKEKAWTGTLSVKVDTGANKYDISPYDDEFSEKFIACVSEEGEVSPDVLQRLGKTTIKEVDVGNQVMIDVAKLGPVRGTVAHKAETETQGTKIDVSTGPATFTMYENPSSSQQKEQPHLVGKVQ